MNPTSDKCWEKRSRLSIFVIFCHPCGWVEPAAISLGHLVGELQGCGDGCWQGPQLPWGTWLGWMLANLLAKEEEVEDEWRRWNQQRKWPEQCLTRLYLPSKIFSIFKNPWFRSKLRHDLMDDVLEIVPFIEQSVNSPFPWWSREKKEKGEEKGREKGKYERKDSHLACHSPHQGHLFGQNPH